MIALTNNTLASFDDAVMSEIAGLETQFDTIRYMRRVTESFGFQTFLICLLPTAEATKLSGNSILSSMPPDLVAKYDGDALSELSSGMRRLRETTTPFHLTLDDWKSASACVPAVDEYAGMLAERGLHQANYFPVHGPEGERAAVIWMGARREISMMILMELQMIAIHVYNRLRKIGAVMKPESPSLSDREIQCLNWTAAGKTSAEIASILGLSEHTVNHYLNHVTKKLDAVNRTQAVVKALRRGIIA